MRFNLLLAVFLCFILFIPDAKSQGVRWYAQAPSEVSVGGSFEVEFTLTNAEPSDVNFPDFKGFEILMGPSTSRSVSIINGKQSSTFGYGFTLSPDKEGSFIIGPATVVINGKKLSTEPIRIQVKKSDLKENEFSDADILAKAELKLKPGGNVYVGQQVNALFLLHYGENINMSEQVDLPDFKGFFIKPMDLQQKSMGITKVGGRDFETLLVDGIALFPQQTGELKVGKAIFPLKKKVSSQRSFFNPFGSYIDRPVATNAASINVKPLPENAPPRFCGAVGSYKMTAEVTSPQVPQNGTIIMKMVVTGDGDSKQMQTPMLDVGADFEVFPGKQIDENEYTQGDRLFHTRTLEYLLSPKKEGQFEIAPSIVIFNPDNGLYEEVKSTPIKLSVGKAGAQNKLNLYQQEETNQPRQNKIPDWIFGVLAALITLTLSLFIYFKMNPTVKSEVDSLAQKKLDAGKVALDRLVKAKSFMEQGAHNEFYKETGEAIYQYLQEKHHIKTEDLNKTYIRNFLSGFSGSEDLISKFDNIISKAELSIYAGYSSPETNIVYEQAKSFIEEMELGGKV